MKTTATLLMLIMAVLPVHGQSSGGLQDGGHGSGGDEKADYTVAVGAGWNTVSVPITVEDFLTTSVFPGALSPAYAYQGGYILEDTLENGIGYWVKFPAGSVLALSGSLIPEDSISVAPGWNLLGSISSPIVASTVTAVGTTVLSNYFTFDDGYQIVGTIEPGRGHWVRVSTGGTLVLASGTTPVPAGAAIAEELSSFNFLSFRDASGEERRVYFLSGEGDAGRFQLPPVPPEGVFDVRFASHDMASRATQDIVLSSAVYPLEVRWEIVTPGDYTLVVDGKEVPVVPGGSLHLAARPSRLGIRIGDAPELPTEFGLAQNYPNPFNPVTLIEYAIPAGSRPAVNLQVFDILGREVATLVNEVKEPGRYTASWDGTGAASGVYYYRLTAGSFQALRKMILVK